MWEIKNAPIKKNMQVMFECVRVHANSYHEKTSSTAHLYNHRQDIGGGEGPGKCCANMAPLRIVCCFVRIHNHILLLNSERICCKLDM